MLSELILFINSPKVLQLFKSQNEFVIIFCVMFLSAIRHASYRSLFMAYMLNLPGTILHELAHFCVGWLLNAKPVNFSLLPRQTEGGYVMGSVSFRNFTFYNSLPTSMAPLLMLPLGYFIGQNFFVWFNMSTLTYLANIFILSIIIENSIPSNKDFREGFRSFWGVIFYFSLFGLAFFYIFFF